MSWNLQLPVSFPYKCYMKNSKDWPCSWWTTLDDGFRRHSFLQGMLCVMFGWNWLISGYGEEGIQLTSMYFHYFAIISPWKRVTSMPRQVRSSFVGHGTIRELPNVKGTWSFIFSSLRDAPCQVWLKFVQWFYKYIYFLELTMCFHFMAVIPHGKWRGLFIWTNMNPLHPMILYALTLAKWFWRRDFFLVFWNWSRT